MTNPTLGTIACPTCGTEGASVRQSKRRGAHLYWQCAECGLSQPTGRVIQERLWRDTVFTPGANPKRPSNVAAVQHNTPPEFDPTELTEPQTEQPTEPPTEARPNRRPFAGVLALAALGLGALVASR